MRRWHEASASARRLARAWLPAGCLLLAPKCLLCLVVYAGAGTWLGPTPPELCGGETASAGRWAHGWLALVAGLALVGCFLTRCSALDRRTLQTKTPRRATPPASEHRTRERTGNDPQ